MHASLAALFAAGLGFNIPKLLAQSALVDWAPTIVVAAISSLGWAFTHGTLTEKVRENGETIKKHDEKLEDHGNRIIVLEQRFPGPRHHMGD